MRRHLFLSVLLALLVAPLGARCGGGQLSTAPSDERATAERDDWEEPTAAPTLDPQTEARAMTATSTPGETSWVSPESGQLPIFVEVLQTYWLSGAALETSLVNVPPNGVFAFDPASQTLLLRPSIVVSPETLVLVGQTTVIHSSGQPLVRGELFQVPPSSTGPVEVIAIDTEIGTLTLAYGDQTFELLPGQSRSFKQTGDQAATHITIITNSGRLASIEPLSGGPDAR